MTWAAGAALLCVATAPTASAQTGAAASGHDAGPSVSLESVRTAGLRDVETLGRKFIALAEEFPESKYDWRPAEGIRSVREVLLLIIGENYGVLGAVLGAKPPAEFADGKAGVDRLMAIRSKAEIVAHLKASVATLRAGLEGIPTAELTSVPFFDPRQLRPLHVALLGVSGDQHEHLGQLIAYARTNGVVPPWSKKPDR